MNNEEDMRLYDKTTVFLIIWLPLWIDKTVVEVISQCENIERVIDELEMVDWEMDEEGYEIYILNFRTDLK